ncbi:hypothetical protein ACOME3_001895 [Neoechinorhynchus agilis]
MLKRTSFAVVMIALSLGNLCKIIVSYMVNITFEILRKQRSASNDQLCQLLELLDICSSYAVSQALVFLAIIRLAVFTGSRGLISYAHRSKFLTFAIIAGMAVFTSLNIGFVVRNFGVLKLKINTEGMTTKICLYKNQISNYVYFAELLLFYSIIPAACMTMFSIVIHRVIKPIRNRSRKDPAINKKMQQHQQTNVAFFFLSMLHFVCTIPYILVWLWITIRPLDFRLYAFPVHIAKFAYYIGVINHSANVYLCALTSKAIRQYVKSFFIINIRNEPNIADKTSNLDNNPFQTSFQLPSSFVSTAPSQEKTFPDGSLTKFFPSSFNFHVESSEV